MSTKKNAQRIIASIFFIMMLMVGAAEAQNRRSYRPYHAPVYRGGGVPWGGNWWHTVTPLPADPPKPAPIIVNNTTNVTVVIQQPANPAPSYSGGSYYISGWTNVQSIPYKTEIYQWVDSKGTLNFSDIPNGRGVKK